MADGTYAASKCQASWPSSSQPIETGKLPK